MHEESELVTGEAVVLDLHVAKLASRALAMALDVVVQFALLLGAVFVLTLAVPAGDGSLALTLFLVFLVLVMVGYPVLFETLSRGRSLGKMAVGLRVVRVDGGPIRFRHALTRGLAGFVVDFWTLGLFGAVAVIVSLCSSDGRRVGDFLAGTLVVRERVPESAGYPAIGMPPGLEGWASQLDLTRLPDGLALASRQFLARFTELRPEASHALGWGLAQQVGNALGAAVPPGVPPWAFLAAVLAERRNRDHARAFQAYAAARAQQTQAFAARGQGYPAQASAGPAQGYPAQANAAQAYPGQAQSQPFPAQAAAPEYAGSSEPTPPRGTPAAPAENPFTPPS
ncbi:RDD family protein [Amycolatopsis sp. WQ 127309]|uniref:RDD family protein n=1 Tax=Amycolatopsis sp. WQ 127309 TaxID=2932773 RepID=UPI001FF529DE|nr:RDD family protein [Amycolatopsis sp. WQ 127309]UOZ10082.1 RDD family protein [Amycolatopsis sp. WQ 127309]